MLLNHLTTVTERMMTVKEMYSLMLGQWCDGGPKSNLRFVNRKIVADLMVNWICNQNLVSYVPKTTKSQFSEYANK